MERQLIKIAKELNIGLRPMVDYLREKGFTIEYKPIAKVSDVMYELLIKKFSQPKEEIDLSKIDDKIFRIWKFIGFENIWHNSDTSDVDDISPSWFKHRKKLQENGKEYRQFIDEQKREHAIETGIIERLYDLKRGITETFIKEGFVQSYLSHGDTNVPTQTLMNHLRYWRIFGI